MRFDTQNAAAYLIWQLKFSLQIEEISHDGSDIILAQLVSGEQILIYLVERWMPLTDIQWIFETNTGQDIYTLMIFWCDMLLPPENRIYIVDDWMAALLGVYQDQIYGFEVAGRDAYFFPVHFKGKGIERFITFGNIVQFTNIQCHIIQSHSPYMPGQWRVATFASVHEAQEQGQSYHRDHFTKVGAPIANYFEVLGVPTESDLPTVKDAYRKLAREHHPDLNSTDEAIEAMKRINDAYERIKRYLEED